ncbi:response regulator transcription factor [Guggenheimella bovis]
MLVDDEKLIREGLKVILQSYGDIGVVCDAKDGEEACSIAQEKEIDVILMDIRMPGMNGVEATRCIKKSKPEIKIVILTTFQDSEYIDQALSYGASGYLLKDSESDVIYKAVQAAYEGSVVVHPSIASAMLHGDLKKDLERVQETYDLSEKEVELIQEVARGYTNKEIADKLFLSTGTVKNQISMLLSKLDLRDRTQLTIFAFKNHLVQ